MAIRFDAGAAEPFVQLPVECGKCGKRESRRVARWRLDLYRDADPERIVEYVICKCGHQYGIKVRAYHGAA